MNKQLVLAVILCGHDYSNYNNDSIYKAQNLVEQDHSKHTYTGVHWYPPPPPPHALLQTGACTHAQVHTSAPPSHTGTYWCLHSGTHCCLHTSTHQRLHTGTGTHWWPHTCTSTHQCLHTCTGTHWWPHTCTSTHQCLHTCTGIHWWPHTCTSTHQCLQTSTGMHWCLRTQVHYTQFTDQSGYDNNFRASKSIFYLPESQN